MTIVTFDEFKAEEAADFARSAARIRTGRVSITRRAEHYEIRLYTADDPLPEISRTTSLA